MAPLLRISIAKGQFIYASPFHEGPSVLNGDTSIRIVRQSLLRSTIPHLPFLKVVDVATPYEPFVGKQNAKDCTTAGPDGIMDLKLQFRATAIYSAIGPVSKGQVKILQITGALKDGMHITGEDVIVIVK